MNLVIYFFKLSNSLHLLEVVCFFSAFNKNKLKSNKDIFLIFKIVGYIYPFLIKSIHWNDLFYVMLILEVIK